MKSLTILLLLLSFFTSAQTVKSFVLIADTSSNYIVLEKKMNLLSKASKKEIDLQERIYDKETNSICLPKTHEDVLYAGSYYPRRYSSSTLSIEYLNYYNNSTPKETMAIVTLITGDKEDAKKELIKLKAHSKSAFMIETEIYMGCMH